VNSQETLATMLLLQLALVVVMQSLFSLFFVVDMTITSVASCFWVISEEVLFTFFTSLLLPHRNMYKPHTISTPPITLTLCAENSCHVSLFTPKPNF